MFQYSSWSSQNVSVCVCAYSVTVCDTSHGLTLACLEFRGTGLRLAAQSSQQITGRNTQSGTGSWHLHSHWQWTTMLYRVSMCGHGFELANASSCCPYTNFPSLWNTPVQQSEVQDGAGIWHINTFFPLFAPVSKPLQAEKHWSSTSLQTSAVLNLIKDITDNKRTIKQQSFQRSAGAYSISHLPRGLQHSALQLSDFSK